MAWDDSGSGAKVGAKYHDYYCYKPVLELKSLYHQVNLTVPEEYRS
jgi:hypothetical protein